MSSEEGGGFGWCNLVIKYLLFVINLLIWLLGVALLGIGIYVQTETAFDGLQLDDLITNPAIGMIILGVILFLIGFCGWLGALLELLVLLIIYCILLGVVLLAEIALVVYIFVQQDSAYAQFESLLATQVESYYDNLELRNLIDTIQGNVFRCCGIVGPNDWQRNIYFNCSSIAFQRCSVPFSCCELDDGDVVNLQCGYRRLDSSDTARFMQDIYTTGCLTTIQNFVNNNLYVVIGVGVGLLVFQLINILLAGGLAYDVYKEKKVVKEIKRRQKEQSNL